MLLPLLCGLLLIQDATPPPAAAAATDRVPLVLVSRIDPARWETIYTTSQDKANELDESEKFRRGEVLGLASSRPGADRVPLFEAYRDGWHVYYTDLPGRRPLPDGTKVRILCYVWEDPGPGRLPVYGVSNPDHRNMRYTTSRERVQEIIDLSRKAKGARLKNHGLVFYLEQLTAENPPVTD